VGIVKGTGAVKNSGIITNTGTAVDLNEEVGAAVPRQTDNYYHVSRGTTGRPSS
jgi:hypothetical protein